MGIGSIMLGIVQIIIGFSITHSNSELPKDYKSSYGSFFYILLVLSLLLMITTYIRSYNQSAEIVPKNIENAEGSKQIQ